MGRSTHELSLSSNIILSIGIFKIRYLVNNSKHYSLKMTRKILKY